MNTDPSTEQDVSTESQRQALDAMSADLVSKLNNMIEEQNARVQAFATQYPQAAAPEPKPVTYHAPQPEPPAETPYPEPQRPTHNIPLPPAAKPRTVAPQPERPQQHAATPPPIRPKAPAAKGKEENSIGCGPLLVIIAIIVILLRCCN